MSALLDWHSPNPYTRRTDQMEMKPVSPEVVGVEDYVKVEEKLKNDESNTFVVLAGRDSAYLISL